MKILALIGKSGTGKSYQSITLCKEKKIDAILDDGLFIHNNIVKAGKSAKRADTKIGAIKRALFTDENHRQNVLKKIKEENPEKILILGTSKQMVDKIVEKLELNSIDEYIKIEDITTEGEREIANKQRFHMGRHLIPAPRVELKHEFSGYFLDPLKIFRGWNFVKEQPSEKTVVRPTYSYIGGFLIDKKVIIQIISHIVNEDENIYKLRKIDIDEDNRGLKIKVTLYLERNADILTSLKKLQKTLCKKIEGVTSFHVYHLEIFAKEFKRDE